MAYTLPMLLLAAIAAISDLRTGKIPNALILAGVIFGLVINLLSKGTTGLLMGLAGFGVGFILLMPGYLLRFTGAGDVKLLATLGLFSGHAMILGIFAASVVTSTFFVLLKFVLQRIKKRDEFFRRSKSTLQTLLITGQFISLSCENESVLKQRLPMAPFYALGCLIVTLLPLMKTGG